MYSQPVNLLNSSSMNGQMKLFSPDSVACVLLEKLYSISTRQIWIDNFIVQNVMHIKLTLSLF